MLLRSKKYGLLVVAASACLVLTGCGGSKKPTTTTTVPPPTIAASATPPKNVTMTISFTDSTVSKPATVTQTETVAEDGSYIDTNPSGNADVAYDANSRTLYQAITGPGAALNITANVATAPPDQTVMRQNDNLAQFVMSQAASGDPRVTNVQTLGRASYQMAFDVNTPTLQFDHATVTVDAQTGLPLVVDTTKKNTPYQKWVVTNFDASPDMSKVSYSLSPANGQTVNRSDDAYVDTQVDLATQQLGYAPIRPQQLPAGYTLTRLITHAAKGESTGANGVNPQDEGVAIEQFNAPNTWGSLYVTTRMTNGTPAKWTDPLATAPGEFTGFSQPVTIQTGAMAQASGEMVVSPAESPHIWAVGQTLVATVSGPFSATALSNAANSLA